MTTVRSTVFLAWRHHAWTENRLLGVFAYKSDAVAACAADKGAPLEPDPECGWPVDMDYQVDRETIR